MFTTGDNDDKNSLVEDVRGRDHFFYEQYRNIGIISTTFMEGVDRFVEFLMSLNIDDSVEHLFLINHEPFYTLGPSGSN